MKYRVLGRSSGLRVSEIAQGAGFLGEARGELSNTYADLTDEDAIRPLLVFVP
jgi:aryl-alcohol dehydrogenase-like predicted oxidoreductase